MPYSAMNSLTDNTGSSGSATSCMVMENHSCYITLQLINWVLAENAKAGFISTSANRCVAI